MRECVLSGTRLLQKVEGPLLLPRRRQGHGINDRLRFSSQMVAGSRGCADRGLSRERVRLGEATRTLGFGNEYFAGIRRPCSTKHMDGIGQRLTGMARPFLKEPGRAGPHGAWQEHQRCAF